MQDEDDAQQEKRRAEAKLEAGLRVRGLLEPDDDIVDAIYGPRAILIAYPEDSAAEHPASPLDQGCACAFSSRRLFALHARLIIGLERVWRAECWGTNVAVVLSAGQEVTAIGLLTGGLATAEQAADFAERLLAQRDLRILELPDDAREEFGRRSAELERRGVPEATLAQLVPRPRTRVGAWLRALLLRDPGLMARHRRGTQWSGEEMTVLQAAFVLQVRRFFGDRRDAGPGPNRIAGPVGARRVRPGLR